MIRTKTARDQEYPRWLELIPGGLMWGTFIGLTLLAIFWPSIAVNILMVYAIFWLARAFIMGGRLIVGYRRYRFEVKQDWIKRLQNDFASNWKDIYHLVIVPTYKEDEIILIETFEAIKKSDYPFKNILVVLAIEERDADRARPIAERLKNKYKNIFFDFIVTEHPKDIPGEVIGKGANITWAGRKIKNILEKFKIPFEKVICTTMDADNRVHKKYFAALAYAYLRHSNPTYATFQPIPMFLNNIWQVPMAIRSISLGSSFWQMIEATRPYRLRNFSAHAQSFAALIKTDFWSTKTIVEDGHQFWRSYFRFNGKHDVVPISVPIYQDAVLSPKGYLDTFREQYLQKRRWAWGASDIPYVLYHMWGNGKLPFWDKWLQASRLIEGHFSWATTSPILAFFAWLPPLLNPEFSQSALAYTFPSLYGRLLTSSLIGMIITLTISALLLPPKPKNVKFGLTTLILEWVTSPIVIPISNIIFSSIPSIDSQTRLMFGKYLEYRVTQKHAHRQDLSRHRAAM